MWRLDLRSWSWHEIVFCLSGRVWSKYKIKIRFCLNCAVCVLCWIWKASFYIFFTTASDPTWLTHAHAVQWQTPKRPCTASDTSEPWHLAVFYLAGSSSCHSWNLAVFYIAGSSSCYSWCLAVFYLAGSSSCHSWHLAVFYLAGSTGCHSWHLAVFYLVGFSNCRSWHWIRFPVAGPTSCHPWY